MLETFSQKIGKFVYFRAISAHIRHSQTTFFQNFGATRHFQDFTLQLCPNGDQIPSQGLQLRPNGDQIPLQALQLAAEASQKLLFRCSARPTH